MSAGRNPHHGRRGSRLRALPVVPLAILVLAATPAVTTADHASFSGPDMRTLAPGQVVVKEEALRIGHFGVPNVAYRDATFVPGETVTATITGLVLRGRFAGGPNARNAGRAELLGPATLTAIVPQGWPSDTFSELVFDPPLAIRYKAPTTVALDCDRHQGQVVYLQIGVTAAFTGTAGTEAWIDTTSGLPFAEIMEPELRCPVRSDFDGDGYADLAAGAPGDRVGTSDLAGAVNILYGSSVGLSAAADQLWTQDSAGVPGTSRAGEGFGSALATGDFNRDGRADLALGAPFDRIDGLRAGGVTILYGTSGGLRATRSQRWSRANLPGALAEGERFGAALGAADWDGDGYDDLAIGVPWADIAEPGDDLGAIEVLYGGPAGLEAGRATVFDRSATGATGPVSGFFGHALAAGDLDGDGYADLAISAPCGNSGGVGDVGILYGGPDGLAVERSQSWSQASPGVPGAPNRDDWFGEALAADDFDGDGIDDLAIGAPGDDVLGNGNSQGAVTVLYGHPDGLTAAGAQWWHQDVANVPGTAANYDWLGEAVAAGDLNRDGYADLAIGVPDDRVGTVNPGAVNVLYGGPGGLAAAGAQRWSQASSGVPGAAEPRDGFGSSLAIGQFGRSSPGDLAIGVPGEAIGSSGHDGLVVVLFGRSGGLASTGAQQWWQDRSGVLGHSENPDRLGTALTP